jgi:hypothetical protein
MKSTLFAILAIAVLTSSRAFAAGPIRVQVLCSTDDVVGNRLCFHLKERIRMSKGFQLISPDDLKRTAISVHLVSIDEKGCGEEGIASAVAIAYNVWVPDFGEQYLTLDVVTVGEKAVDEMADSILAEVDKQSSSRLGAKLLRD